MYSQKVYNLMTKLDQKDCTICLFYISLFFIMIRSFTNGTGASLDIRALIQLISVLARSLVTNFAL